jgi:hypothetical protein
MTAWIMTNSDGIPTTKNMYCLWEGFKELGEEIKFYSVADVFTERIPYTEHNIVVGHIDQCRRHIRNITGKEIPNLDYPRELSKFLGRDIKMGELGDIYKLVTRNESIEPIFVKSFEQKQLTGFVCSSFSDFTKHCTGYEMNTKVYISDVLKIRSEYRTYIHKHDIVSSLRYKGDYDKAPSKVVLEEMLYLLRHVNMPIAYSIDVGILDTGETILIECNDGFALGNYGVNSMKYAEMHRDRWYQLINA